MTSPKPNTPRPALDLGLILRALWPPLLAWLTVTAAVAVLGYPAVLCVTPLAWVLALYAGWASARDSRRGRGWLEAGVAGGLLGLAQGVLFGVISAVAAPGDAAEAGSALLRGAGIGLGGLVGCATLALLAAAWTQRPAAG